MKKNLPSIIGQLTVSCLAFLVSGVALGQPASPPPGLRPSEPIVCSGNRDLTLRGRYIAADHTAAQIQGNCDVYLIDCYVVAGGVAIQASGNSGVHIVGSTIEGAGGALLATGNASISYTDSKIIGSVRGSGQADLIDGGGNVVLRHDAEVLGRQPEPQESERRGRRGRDLLRIGGIEIGSRGVRVGGVVVDENGVDVGGGAVVIERGGVEVAGAIVVDAEGYILIGEDEVVDPSPDWRRRGGSDEDIDHILVELGAVTEADRIRLDLAGDVLFDFGRADVQADAVPRLSAVADLIRHQAVGRVTVVGHTDSLGSEAVNQELSQRRALAVMRWLHERQGIPAEFLAGRGMGETQPVAHNTKPDGSDNPAGRARNRRVEILISTTR